MSFDVPIAFCIFNRPEVTQRVFDAIARQKPKQLFVIADGAREDVEGESELVAQTRAIVDQIDWPCNLQCNFAKRNMGCRNRMATGLSWAFGLAEQLIILEDDCLPDQSFFGYCRELLIRYQSDPNVMMISGDNFQPHRRTENSYYFSRWTHIWGWASWRRAWQHFDVELKSWPEVRLQKDFVKQFENEQEYRYWSRIFDGLVRGEIDTWDFAWGYACWVQGGLTILPEVNLVSNLGFGLDATHTRDPNSSLANLPTSAMGALRHPPNIERNEIADQWTYEKIFKPEVEQSLQVVTPKRKLLDRFFKRRSA